MNTNKKQGLPIGVGKFVEFASFRENKRSNLDVAKNGKLFSFLKETSSPLGESHLKVALVLDPFYFQLLSPHILTPDSTSTLPSLALLPLPVTEYYFIHLPFYLFRIMFKYKCTYE